MAKNILPEVGYTSLAAEFAIADMQAESEALELFGESEFCTDEEAEIIFSSILTHAEKLAALNALHKGKVQ
jgi:hypothetical protein